MLNAIIDSISLAIFNEFGEDYTIYTEIVEQGLKEPCFIISAVSPLMEVEIKNRYAYENKFAINYFPKTKEIKNEFNDVILRLYKTLELIDFKEDKTKLRGIKKNCVIDKDILHFYVNYNCKLLNNEVDEKMEELETLFR